MVDLPPLVQYYLKLEARALGQRAIRIESSALRLLRAYIWPGDVRESSVLFDQAVTLNPSGYLTAISIEPLIEAIPLD